MIYLQKTLILLCMPISLVCILLLIACITKKRSISLAALALLYICSLPITAHFLLQHVEGRQIKIAAQDAPQADAIVVLGGFLNSVQSTQGEVLEWGMAARFFAGLDLFKANKAEFIVFADEQLPWLRDAGSSSAFLDAYAKGFGVPPNKILQTTPVQSTLEEAAALSSLANSYNIKSIILVTSAFHVQRAKAQFEKVGFIVYPYPVDFRGSEQVKLGKIGISDFIPDVGELGKVSIALTEIMARVYYSTVSK
jgi:uncharacterized SAM-binding protein YcdF (DUF218 family)